MEMQQGIRIAAASGFRRHPDSGGSRIAARLPDRTDVRIAAAPGLERRPDSGDIRHPDFGENPDNGYMLLEKALKSF
jgi:hypothetical protein